MAESDDETRLRAWAAGTWLDDFWSVVLAFPMVAAFVPGLQDVVSRGFQIVATDAPTWYLAAVGGAISWAFARRSGFIDNLAVKAGGGGKPK